MEPEWRGGLYEVEPGQLGFRATLMEGPDIDLAVVAGLPDDDPVVEQAWENANWKSILDVCFSAEVLDEADLGSDHESDERDAADSDEPDDGEDDEDDDDDDSGEIPGMSDTRYVIRVPDPVRFAAELRAAFTRAATDPEQLG